MSVDLSLNVRSHWSHSKGLFMDGSAWTVLMCRLQLTLVVKDAWHNEHVLSSVLAFFDSNSSSGGVESLRFFEFPASTKVLSLDSVEEI